MSQKRKVLGLVQGVWAKSLVDFVEKEKFDVDVEPFDDSKSQLQKAFEKYDVILLGPEFKDFSQVNWNLAPVEVARLHCFDAYVKQQGQWWPRCFLLTALQETLIRQVGSLNVRSKGLVVGLGREARIVIALLSTLGFQTIQVTTPDEDENTVKVVESLRSQHFGVEFELLRSQDLLLQAGNAGVVCNTVSPTQYPDLILDLSYFNFLQPHGVVIDLSYEDSLLLDEAKGMGAKLLSTSEVFKDYHRLWSAWVQKAFH